jgi:segregation and condensation protein A
MINKTVSVSELFSKAKNKIEVIVTFLSILELIRMKEVVIMQKELFSEIVIARNETNIIPHGKRE